MNDGLLPDDASPPEGLGKLFADQAPAKPAEPYRTLARKYRPSSVDDLVGQKAMVRTLSNAFELDRIHQADLIVLGVSQFVRSRAVSKP